MEADTFRRRSGRLVVAGKGENMTEILTCWFCDVSMEVLEDGRQRCPECGCLVRELDLIEEYKPPFRMVKDERITSDR